ncbi:glycosyltransferase family A protein [Magnetospirillum sp. SS-4]|uniref:glycosyltransferase family 2 protein n=1 Tax=Magnetospirillum sp. SS-4 TaxID=2681465 RepID=UPI00137C855A|nr:glycosyltransferase family A protein [Magnetospirillum sp. SS-4]CAA7621941.1 Glycosyl transferase family 2 [Magnetospirillum sp. SS-4]
MTHSSPYFSVVMPAYNAIATLAEATSSVIAQTDPDWELLIVDDGSTDATFELACRLALDEPRIKVLTKANGGVSAARNHGAALASGKVIAFLDSDDAMMPDALVRHRRRFESDPELAVSYGRVAFCDFRLEPLGRCSAHPPTELHPAMALGENPVCTGSNLVVRSDIFAWTGGFDETLRHAEDQEWLFRALASGAGTISGIDRVLVLYRASPGGLHGDLVAMEAGWEAMIARAALAAPEAVRRHHSLAKALHLRSLARRALRVPSQAGQALPFMLRALAHAPSLLWHSRRTIQTLAGALAAALIPTPKGRAVLARLLG